MAYSLIMADAIQSAGKALIDSHLILQRVGLARGMRIADLGCGRTGHFLFPAAKIVEDVGLVYGIDILKEVLDNLRSRVRSGGFDNIQLVWSDIEAVGKIPIPDNSLDACFLVNVLYQLKYQEQTFRESARLLKSGGRLVVIDWARKLGTLGPEENRLASITAVSDLATATGFVVVDNFAAGDYHYCLVLRKI